MTSNPTGASARPCGWKALRACVRDRNDNGIHEGKVLQSFGINPGGYVGFHDPEKKTDTTFAHKNDPQAKAVMARKAAAKLGHGWRRKHAATLARDRGGR